MNIREKIGNVVGRLKPKRGIDLSPVLAKLPWLKIDSVLMRWRVALGLSAFVIVLCLGLIWGSGFSDTSSAIQDGRRLLISLADNSIEGNNAKLTPDESPATSAESPVAPAESPAASGKSPAESPSQSVAESTMESPVESPAESVDESPVAQESPVIDEELVAAATATAIATETAPILPNDLGEPNAIKSSATPIADVKAALAEKSAFGTVPIISGDGEQSWHYYARKYERKGSEPMIAIIITGLGQNKIVTNAAIKLDENIALSFMPYAKDAASWASAARRAGHEVLIDLPLEPSNYPASDPGPYGLFATKNTHENASRLQWLMSRFQGYIGFVSPQNEVFTSNDETFTALLQSLVNRGLMMVIGRAPAKTSTKQIIDTTATPNILVDVLLDEELSAAAIQTRFSTLQKIANKRGYAVALAQGYPLTIQQIGLWTATLEKQGVVLAPISFVTSVKPK